MEDKDLNINIEQEPPIAQVYEIEGCKVTVRRKFEDEGIGILEQLVSILLDLLDKKDLELSETN